MDSLEVSAKTVDEAVSQALAQLDLTRAQVEVVVLSEGSRSLFGLRRTPARVRVTPRQPAAAAPGAPGDAVSDAQGILEGLLQAMGLTEAAVERRLMQEGPTESVVLNIAGDDLGVLIGRHGETLSSLQYIVNLMLGRLGHSHTPVMVDAGGYLERRYESLRAMALRMAERAKATGRPVEMHPLPARERRIVHLALSEYKGVTTESVGEGDARAVSIIPARNPSS
ncbi:MAG: protein jag [Dehalococcoidia bacterium]|nr:protein jag [Dehalococcoidia bacterium]